MDKITAKIATGIDYNKIEEGNVLIEINDYNEVMHVDLLINRVLEYVNDEAKRDLLLMAIYANHSIILRKYFDWFTKYFYMNETEIARMIEELEENDKIISEKYDNISKFEERIKEIKENQNPFKMVEYDITKIEEAIKERKESDKSKGEVFSLTEKIQEEYSCIRELQKRETIEKVEVYENLLDENVVSKNMYILNTPEVLNQYNALKALVSKLHCDLMKDEENLELAEEIKKYSVLIDIYYPELNVILKNKYNLVEDKEKNPRR